MLNADALYSAIAVDSVVATITTTDYGHAVEGLQLADFSLEEVSPTPGAIAISGVSETSAGVYTISFAAQTSGDVLRLSASKDRFDFSAMSDGTNDILIP